MPIPYQNGERGVAAVGSMTVAIKAQRVLASSGITVEIISLSPRETKRGCAYGVSYPIQLEANVRNVLRTARISVSQYFKKGGSQP